VDLLEGPGGISSAAQGREANARKEYEYGKEGGVQRAVAEGFEEWDRTQDRIQAGDLYQSSAHGGKEKREGRKEEVASGGEQRAGEQRAGDDSLQDAGHMDGTADSAAIRLGCNDRSDERVQSLKGAQGHDSVSVLHVRRPVLRVRGNAI
jgi:hypothetical protein